MADVAMIQARLASYYEAEAQILKSQRYKVGQGGTARENERARLEEVRAAITQLEAELATARQEAAGGRRMYTLVPR